VDPHELKERLGSGLLSFPVTPFSADLDVDHDALAAHLERLAGHPVAGLFAAGGTGEFFSLTGPEVDAVVRVTVGAKLAAPVVGPAGYGTAIAVDMARSAQGNGADGVLLLPPYLTEVGQAGLAAHVRAVCQATRLGVVVYHRANARFELETMLRLAEECPNLVGFKDGIGDIELLATLSAAVGDRLVYIGGLPTAETFALPYLELGVSTYSSAIFNFAPDWATAFYDAVRRRDHEHVQAGIRDFITPYLAIRNRRPGYAVAIVKAGVRLAGHDVGPVRPPLTDLTPDELEELGGLVTSVVRA
jgi:5-dehydro-4-deoxyglucarate dehydratase